MLKRLVNSNLFIFIILIAFIAMPLLKYYSFNSNYFDFGVTTNDIYAFYRNNFNNLYLGNFKFYQLILSYIVKALNLNNISYILILIQSLCLISPIFFLKKINVGFKFIYLLFPPIWIANLSDFHIDSFSIPLIFLFLLTSNKFLKTFLFFFIFFIKPNYSLLICSIILIDNFKISLKYFWIIIFSFLIFGIRVYFTDFEDYIKIFNFSNFNYIFMIEKLFFFIFNLWPLIFLKFNKNNYKFIFYLIPNIIFFFLVTNPRYNSIFSHYNLIFTSIVLYSCYFFFKEKIFENYFRFRIFQLVSIINHILFSCSIFSFLFFINIFNFYHISSYTQFNQYKERVHFIKSLIDFKDDVYVNNTINIDYLSNRVFYHPIKDNLIDFHASMSQTKKFFIINKNDNNFFLGDKLSLTSFDKFLEKYDNFILNRYEHLNIEVYEVEY